MPTVSRASLKEQLHSWIYFTYLVLIPYLHHSHRRYFFALLAAGWFLHFMDAAVSVRPWLSLEQAQLNGFSKTQVLVWQILNVLVYQLIWCFMSHYMLSDKNGEKLDIEWGLDFRSVLQVLVSLALSDLGFYWSHKWLHESELGAKWHHVHHCTSDTSWSSSLFFHPLDFMVEFGVPLSAAWTVNYALRWDPRALMWTCCVIMAWYSAEHDQTIFYLHHIDHHRLSDSAYAIYTAYKKPNRNDTVKHKMKWLEKYPKPRKC